MIFAILLIFSSCKDDYTICDLSKVVVLKNGFYQFTSGIEKPVAASLFSLTQIDNSPVYNNVSNISKFNFSLNPAATSVKYQIITSAGSVPDTVTYSYNTENVQLSTNCGNVYVNTLTSVSTTTHTLDSIKIFNSTVNTESGENIKIYF